MKTRILYGSLMIIALGALLWADWYLQHRQYFPIIGLPLAALFGLLAAGGTLELARLTEAAGLVMQRKMAVLYVLAVATTPVWRQVAGAQDNGTILIVAAVVGAAFFVQMVCCRKADAIKHLSATLLAVAYLGGLGACVLALRVKFGLAALALFLACVKCTDIGAYFVGSAIGRRKLIPWLSPGKSWEGLFGGLAAAAGVALLLNRLLAPLNGDEPIMQAWRAAAFGAVVGLVGQFGDLCESLLKRDAGLKDSGALVPSFGGVLDIIDSPLVAAPAGYVLLLALR